MSFTIVSVDVATGTVTTNHPGGGAVYVSTFVSINGVVGRDGGGGYGEYASGGMAQTAVYPTLIGGYNTTIFLLDANVYLDGDGVNPPGTIIPLSAPFTIGPAPVLDNTVAVITSVLTSTLYMNVPSYPLAFNYKFAKVLTDACGNETVSVIPNANTFTNTSRGNNKNVDIYLAEFDGINAGDIVVLVSASNPTLELSNHFTVLTIMDTTAVNILTNQFTINASNYDATAAVYLSVNGTPYVNNTFTIDHLVSSTQVVDVSELTGVSLLGGSDVITIDACGSGLTLKTLSMLVPLEIAPGILGPSITNNTSNNISAYLYYAVYDPLYTLRSNAESHIDSSAILTTAVELVPGLTHYMWSDVGLTDPIHSDMKFKLILADGTNRVGSPLSGSINTAPERPTLYAARNDITINSFDLSSDIINLTASKDLIQLYFRLFPARTVQGFEAEDLCGQGQTFTVPVGTSDINFYTITGRHLNDWGGYRVYIMGLPRHPELIGISGSGAPGVAYATHSYPAEIPEPTITIVSADSGTGEMVVQSSGGFRFCRVVPANQFVRLANPIPNTTISWNTNNRFSVVAGLNTINYVDLLDVVLDFSLYVMIVTSDGMTSELTTPHDLKPPPTPAPTQVTINSFDICNNTITMTSTYGGPFPATLECEFTNSNSTDISFNGSPIFTVFNGTRTYNFFDMILQDEINDTTLRYLADKKVRVSSARGWGNLTLRDHLAKYVSAAATAPAYPTLGNAYIQETTANNKIVIMSTYATPFTAYLDNSGGSTGLDYRRSPIMTINPGTNTITNTYQRMDVGTHFKLRAMLGWGDQYVDNPFTVTVQGSLPDQPVHIDALGDDENSIVVVSAYRFERAYLRVTNDGSAAVSYNIDPSSIFMVPENPTAGQPGNGTFNFVGTLLTLTGINKLIDSRSSTIAVYDADSNRRISGIFRRSGLSQRSVVPPIAGDIRITNVSRTGITFDSSNNMQGVLLTVNGTPIQPVEFETAMGGLFVAWGHNQFASHTFTTSAQVQFIRPVDGGSALQLSNVFTFILGGENTGVVMMTSATAQSGNVVFFSTKAVTGVQFATRSPTNVDTVHPGTFNVVQGTNTIPYTSKVSDGSTLTDLSGYLMALVLAENNELLVSANTTTVAGLPVNQIITPVNPTVSTTLGALVSAPGSVSASDIQAAVQASPGNIQVASAATAVSAVGDRTLMNQRNNPNNVIVASQDGTLKLRSVDIASADAKDVSIAVKKVDTQTFNINLIKIDACGNKVSSTIGNTATYDTLVVEIPTPPSLVLTINHVDNSGTVTPLFTGIDLGALANNGTYTNPSNRVSIQRLFANTSSDTIKYSITGPFSEQNQVFTTTTITDAVLSTNVITYNATGDVSGAVQFAVAGVAVPGTFTVAVGDNQTINFQTITGASLGTYAEQPLTMIMAGSGGTLTSAAYVIPALPVALTSTSFVIENFDLSNNTFQLTSSPLVAYDISAYIVSSVGTSTEFNLSAFTSPHTFNFATILGGSQLVAGKTLTLHATAAFGGIAISALATAPAFPGAGAVTLHSYNTTTNVLSATSTYESTFTATLTDASSNTTSASFSVPTGGPNDINVSGLSLELSGGVLTMSATSSYGSAVVSDTLTVSPPPPPPAPEPLTSSSFTISHIDISNNTFRITPVSSVVYDVSAVINVVMIGGSLYTTDPFNIAAHPDYTTINYGTIMGGNGNAKIAGKTLTLYATVAFGSMAISAQATAPNYPNSSSVTLNSYNVSTNVLNVNSMYGTSFTAVLLDSSSNTTSAPFTVSTSIGANITVSGLSLASTGGVLTMFSTPSYGSTSVSNTLTVSAVAAPPAPAPPAPPRNDASGNVICVCAGTMIMTPTGERAVESLSAGDLIVASDGRKLPIVSLHYTEVASCNAKNAPYVIKAGAFGKGLPHTDLAVSPLHALEVSKGKWMIPSMTTDPALRSKMARYAEGQATTYYHLELANYLTDNFIANGVVSESNGLPWQLRNAVPMKVYSQMRNGYMTRASAAPATVQKTKAANKASR